MRCAVAVQQRAGILRNSEPDPAAFPDLEEPPVEGGGGEGQVGILDDVAVEADAALLDQPAALPHFVGHVNIFAPVLP